MSCDSTKEIKYDFLAIIDFRRGILFTFIYYIRFKYNAWK